MTTIRTRAAKGSALSATEYDAAITLDAVAQPSNYALTAAHNREVHELANGVAATLPTASGTLTETDDWQITLKGMGAACSINPAGQTVDGSTSTIALYANEVITIQMNATQTGFNILHRIRADTPVRGVSAKIASDQSLTDSTWTPIIYNTEIYDVFSAYNNSTGLLTVPTQFNYFRVIANIFMTANTAGTRTIELSSTTAHAGFVLPGDTSIPGGQSGNDIQVNSGWVERSTIPSFYVLAFQTSGVAWPAKGTYSRLSVDFCN